MRMTRVNENTGKTVRARLDQASSVSLQARWVRICIVFMMLMIPFGLSGCYDRTELEQQAFVSVLGIDKAPQGLIDCTFRFAQPVNPTGSSSQGGTEPLAGKEAVTVRAHSIDEAMILVSGSIERSITFSHLTFLLVGSDLAKEGIIQYIQPMLRYREFRRTVPIALSKQPAQDVIQALQPMLDTSVAKVADGITLVSNRTGLLPRCRLQDLITAFEVPHQAALVPLYSVNQYVSDKESKLPQDGSISYQAGKIQRTGGNPVDWMGGGVFKGDKLVDLISGEDAFYLRLLQGGMYHAKIDLRDPKHPKQNIGIMLHKEGTSHYDISLVQPLQVHISMPIDVDVTNISSGEDYSDPAKRTMLEKGLSDQVNNHVQTLLHRLMVSDKADVVPVSRYIRGKFGTYQAFANYPWIDRMKTASIVVDAKVKVRRFGVQVEPIQATT